MATNAETIEKVEWLRNQLTQFATGGGGMEDYPTLRHELLADPRIRDKLPGFLRKCRTAGDFWSFIKAEFAHYQERREYLRDQFDPVLTYLESSSDNPIETAGTAILTTVDSEHVRDAWRKAIDRRDTDPEGAITIARSLLEATAKHILDETSTPYDVHAELSKLYGKVADVLKLSPAQHTEHVFKQILGGCQTVVEALAALRNRLSDAHGKGQKGVRPAPRHAELAVNLAGSMATFLISTYEARKERAGERRDERTVST